MHLRGRHLRTFFFIDNEAARVSLIKGSSSNVHSDRLVWIFHDYDVECQSRVWIARVPSSSNPADAPSRQDFQVNEVLFRCHTIPAPSMGVGSSELPWESSLLAMTSA